MRYFYAELDDSNKVKCILETDRPMALERMVEIESFEESKLGKLYEDGSFVDPE